MDSVSFERFLKERMTLDPSIYKSELSKPTESVSASQRSLFHKQTRPVVTSQSALTYELKNQISPAHSGKIPIFFTSSPSVSVKDSIGSASPSIAQVPPHLAKLLGPVGSNSVRSSVTMQFNSTGFSDVSLPFSPDTEAGRNSFSETEHLRSPPHSFQSSNFTATNISSSNISRAVMTRDLRAKLMAVASGSENIPKIVHTPDATMEKVYSHIRNRSFTSDFTPTHSRTNSQADIFLNNKFFARNDNQAATDYNDYHSRTAAAIVIQRWWRAINVKRSKRHKPPRKILPKLASDASSRKSSIGHVDLPETFYTPVQSPIVKRPIIASNINRSLAASPTTTPPDIRKSSFSLFGNSSSVSSTLRLKELVLAYVKGLIIRGIYYHKETKQLVKQIYDVGVMLSQLRKEHLSKKSFSNAEQKQIVLEDLYTDSFYCSIRSQYESLKIKFLDLFNYASDPVTRRRLGVFKIYNHSRIYKSVAYSRSQTISNINGDLKFLKRGQGNLTSPNSNVTTPIKQEKIKSSPEVTPVRTSQVEEIPTVELNQSITSPYAPDYLDRHLSDLDDEKHPRQFLKKSNRMQIPTNKVDWSNVKAKTINRIDAKRLPPRPASSTSTVATVKPDFTKVKTRVDTKRRGVNNSKLNSSASAADIHVSKNNALKSDNSSSVNIVPISSADSSPKIRRRSDNFTGSEFKTNNRDQSFQLHSSPESSPIIESKIASFLSKTNFADYSTLKFDTPSKVYSEAFSSPLHYDPELLEKQREIKKLDSLYLAVQQNMHKSMDKLLQGSKNKSLALFNSVPAVIESISKNESCIGVIESQIDRLKSLIRNESEKPTLTFSITPIE